MAARYIIFLCDIKDYSLLSQREQVKTVQELWRAASRLLADISGPKSSEYASWGTGDGLYIVVKHSDEQLQLDLVEFARKLIEKTKSKFELRCALHIGVAHPIPLKENRVEFSGTGLNEAARIVSFAKEGQIVYSDEFTKPFENALSKNAREFALSLVPSTLEPAFTVSVKHAVKMSVRWSSEHVSSKMVDVLLATKHIEIELDYLLRLMCSKTKIKYSSSRPARMSIFIPARNENLEIKFFEPTRFRVVFPPSKKSMSQSLYELTNKSAFGEAWIKKWPAIIHQLPDYSKSPTDYVKRVSKFLNISPVSVEAWKFKQRAFVLAPVFPFGAKSERPIALLCFDTGDAMEELDKEHLKLASTTLTVEATTRLGPLLKLYFGS
jgi:hypothetical protein